MSSIPTRFILKEHTTVHILYRPQSKLLLLILSSSPGQKCNNKVSVWFVFSCWGFDMIV